MVHEIFGLIVLVHAYVFEVEFNLDEVVGKERAEADQLVPESLNELIIDIGDPSLDLDGHVLKHEVNAFVFFKNCFQLDHIRVLQSSQHFYLFVDLDPFCRTADLIDLANQHLSILIVALLTLPKGVSLVHRNYYLFRHLPSSLCF